MEGMRSIGHIEDGSAARNFSDYLFAEGIENDCEAVADGGYEIWVHAEDEIARAEALYRAFLDRPEDARYQAAAKRAAEIRRELKAENARMKKLVHTREQTLRKVGGRGMAPLTKALLFLCSLVWVLSAFGVRPQFVRYLFISDYVPVGGGTWWDALVQVREGQVWRLVTPILLHFGIMHFAFNMLWLWDLGNTVETRQGTLFLAAFILVTAVLSNVAQFAYSGPHFGGMSGVVYALLGYIWMKSRYDPGCGYHLHTATVVMMGFWFVLGFTGTVGDIANVVHGVGLAVGVLWGYLSAQYSPMRS
ncbi:MAG: rhomboid family intramembrane serine protease [Spartobacteria bacterium]|nr:rhomboid family intramembrane serine protease [Spartobacteria bacterium]